jgi:glutamate/tyrosine decarboxylase-like PLP-dependent enzyme
MIEPENASESTSLDSLTGESAALQTLRDEVRTLRSLFSAAAMALLLLSFGINAYLYYQDRILRQELDTAKKMAQEFETVRRPMVNTFITRLQEFARSHPDIKPILDKYGIRPAASAPAPTPAPSPAKNGK